MKQIPEQAKELGIFEDEVVNKIMLGETVDTEFFKSVQNKERGGGCANAAFQNPSWGRDQS